MPLEPYTDHASFVECYDLVVPPLARAFKPDVIVAQNGCDGHAIDPLTHLHYLTPTFEHVAVRSHELAHELCDGKLIALGGGGYGALDGRAASLGVGLGGDQRPGAAGAGARGVARALARARARSLLPTRMHNALDAIPPVPRQAEITERNRQVASEVARQGLGGR